MFDHVFIVTVAAAIASVAVIPASATSVDIFNNCSYQVDPAFYPMASEDGTATGGFPLVAGASQVVTLYSGWSGRIWGRTGCNSAGVCTSGGCPSGGENCTSPAPTGPTLAQFTIDGYADSDYFDPTSGDNFNIPLTIEPGSGCSTAPVSCIDANGDGNGCGATSSCPTGTSYTIQFC